MHVPGFHKSDLVNFEKFVPRVLVRVGLDDSLVGGRSSVRSIAYKMLF